MTNLVKNEYFRTKVGFPSRVSEAIQDKHLTISSGRLFCGACHKEVSVKKSVVKLHIASAKNKSAKEKQAQKEAREEDIARALKTVMFIPRVKHCPTTVVYIV